MRHLQFDQSDRTLIFQNGLGILRLSRNLTNLLTFPSNPSNIQIQGVDLHWICAGAAPFFIYQRVPSAWQTCLVLLCEK